MSKQSKEVFVLHFNGKLLDTREWGKILDTSITPKRIYLKIGRARNGKSQLPKEIQDRVEIVRYVPDN